MTKRAAVHRQTLTIADLVACDRPPLMPLWPDLGEGVLRLSESTTYEYADAGRLPVGLVRVGRRRYARTVDVLAWLGLTQNGGVESNRQAASTPPPAENALIHTSTN